MIVSILLFTSCLGHTQALARPKVALVLGGGAARGLSHIGLLKVFEEEGIPVDYLVGASMGSVMAGLYATGMSADNLHYLATTVNLAELFVPTVPPKGGFFSTERYTKFLNTLTHNAQLESLPISYSSVAINLNSGKETILERGSLIEAMLASMAIPGVFPPTKIGDDYYVDGGMRSLVPVEAATTFDADLIIAVDVRSQLGEIDHDDLFSNVQLASLLVLGTDTPRQLEMADIVIAPGVAFESYMDFDRADYFISKGYEAARQAVPDIREALLNLDPDFLFTAVSSNGIPEAEFAELVDEALKSAYNESPTNGSMKTRFYFDMDSKRRKTTRFDISFPIGKFASTVPVLAGYGTQKRDGHTTRTYRLGVGNCDRRCPSLFWREASNHPTLAFGVAVQGKTPGNWRFEGEWENGTTTTGWKIQGAGPLRPKDPQFTDELHVVLGRDPRGLYGLPSTDSPGISIVYKHFVPFHRMAFWEAVNTSTHVYIGGGLGVSAKNQRLNWQPIAEVGIGFEARLFGLYPLHSDLALTYSGKGHPWSLRWTLGEW